jgi:hypothetical protein
MEVEHNFPKGSNPPTNPISSRSIMVAIMRKHLRWVHRLVRSGHQRTQRQIRQDHSLSPTEVDEDDNRFPGRGLMVCSGSL